MTTVAGLAKKENEINMLGGRTWFAVMNESSLRPQALGLHARKTSLPHSGGHRRPLWLRHAGSRSASILNMDPPKIPLVAGNRATRGAGGQSHHSCHHSAGSHLGHVFIRVDPGACSWSRRCLLLLKSSIALLLERCLATSLSRPFAARSGGLSARRRLLP